MLNLRQIIVNPKALDSYILQVRASCQTVDHFGVDDSDPPQQRSSCGIDVTRELNVMGFLYFDESNRKSFSSSSSSID